MWSNCPLLRQDWGKVLAAWAGKVQKLLCSKQGKAQKLIFLCFCYTIWPLNFLTHQPSNTIKKENKVSLILAVLHSGGHSLFRWVHKPTSPKNGSRTQPRVCRKLTMENSFWKLERVTNYSFAGLFATFQNVIHQVRRCVSFRILVFLMPSPIFGSTPFWWTWFCTFQCHQQRLSHKLSTSIMPLVSRRRLHLLLHKNL